MHIHQSVGAEANRINGIKGSKQNHSLKSILEARIMSYEFDN